jgi:flagella basal body P-ring formation protein FlgA
VRVFADRAVARRPIARGAVIGSTDIEAVRAAVADAPLRELPSASALAGARARRAIEPGTVVRPSDVIRRRLVEPGDTVTAVVRVGPVEVSATFRAADGGDAGDCIRLVNPDTRRFVRGRVVNAGFVEVTDDRD